MWGGTIKIIIITTPIIIFYCTSRALILTIMSQHLRYGFGVLRIMPCVDALSPQSLSLQNHCINGTHHIPSLFDANKFIENNQKIISISTLGTISRNTYQQSTSNPIRKITTVKTTEPSSILANLVTFGYISYKTMYSKWNDNGWIERPTAVREIRTKF